MENETDKELYQKFLKGNKQSFEEIVIRYKDNIIYFLQGYVKDIYIAEDIAQDVFVYILMHKQSYNFKYSLKTYLYTIAKTKALNYLKRAKKIIVLEEIQINEIDELEDKVFKRETQEYLKQAIKKLKPEYQNAIYLADIEELSYKEIGKILTKTDSRSESFNS